MIHSVVCKQAISIHALREEGDVELYPHQQTALISIHALREEGDEIGVTNYLDPYEFLSTPSARRATLTVGNIFPHCFLFLSTPSARRATRG